MWHDGMALNHVGPNPGRGRLGPRDRAGVGAGQCLHSSYDMRVVLPYGDVCHCLTIGHNNLGGVVEEAGVPKPVAFGLHIP